MTEYFNIDKTNLDKSTWNDRWLAELILPGKKGGYFVEAGACAGISGSCTYFLEKNLEWSGLLVEPIDNWFNKLTENRPNSCCLNACLAPQSGEIDFCEFTQIQGRSTTVDIDHISQKDTTNEFEYHLIKKKAMTLEDALVLCSSPRHIDYMALDLEGAEHSVLKDFPFSQYTFSAISVEGHECNELLTSAGYIRVSNPFTKARFENYFVSAEIAQQSIHRIQALEASGQ